MDYIKMMLADKGYYDYDYEQPKETKSPNITKATPPDKLAKKLARFGWLKPKDTKPSPEEIQQKLMEENEQK